MNRTFTPPFRLNIAPHELQQIAQRFGGRFELKGLSEGPLSGSHKSRSMGASLDFAQHRDYVPGDDPKHLDWRAFAKNDRLVIKQYQQETNLRVYIVVDRSLSMAYQGGATVSKGVYVGRIAALISWMLLVQGEAVGLATFGAQLGQISPSSSQREHFWRLIRALESSAWEPDTQPASALSALAERLPPRSLIIILSDAFDFALSEDVPPNSTFKRSAVVEARGGEGLSALSGRLKAQGHTVCLLHVLDPFELSFPFDELSLFQGLEGEDSLKLDPQGVRQAYLAEINAFCKGLKHRLLAQGVRYARCTTDLPLERALALLTGREGSPS